MNPDASTTDAPTGLQTRQGFDYLFRFAFSLAERGLPPTLLLIGPDGDRDQWEPDLLDSLGAALKDITRQTDVVARYEDDVFACLLVDCNRSGAIIAADRFRTGLAEFTEQRGVTLSAGVASYSKELDTPETMTAQAQRALRAARDAGGNRTELPEH